MDVLIPPARRGGATRIRPAAMLGVAVTLLLMGASYLIVGTVPPRPGAVSVVIFVESRLPQLWPTVFGVAAGALFGSAATGRLHLPACAGATGVLVGFDVALWVGSLASNPPGSWVAAAAVGGLAFVAGGLALSFARFPVSAP